MIVSNFCDIKKHVGGCSDYEKLWILEQYRLPIDAPFYIVATSLQEDICCHHHHSEIWLLHSMNMKMLAINYSRNGIIIVYILPIKVLLCRLSIKIICTVTPSFFTAAKKT